MSKLISKPPSQRPERPEVFAGGMMPVPDEDLHMGVITIDLRHLKLDPRQLVKLEDQIREVVHASIGKDTRIKQYRSLNLVAE